MNYQKEKETLTHYVGKIGQYIQAGLEVALNTRWAYQAALRHYANWCQRQGLAALIINACRSLQPSYYTTE